jgi:hypothetical protein
MAATWQQRRTRPEEFNAELWGDKTCDLQKSPLQAGGMGLCLPCGLAANISVGNRRRRSIGFDLGLLAGPESAFFLQWPLWLLESFHRGNAPADGFPGAQGPAFRGSVAQLDALARQPTMRYSFPA